jgi:DNA-binding NtrC family response regulator
MSSLPSTLLVEDNDGLAESLVAAFSDQGLGIDRARDWDDGLKRFRICGHELVIADYNLPGSEHGLLLLLEVKQLLPSTRLVLISGALSQQAARALEPPGLIDAYFRKGLDLAGELLPWVIDAFKRTSQPTDWQRFAAGHLSDPDAQRAEVQRIDAILRADVDRRG